MANLDLQKVTMGLGRTLYRGVAIQKFPFDYLMYQMIIHNVRPDLIIEIGTMHGGSALYLADLLEIMNIEKGEVHSIDLVDLAQRKKLEVESFNPKEAKNYPDIVSANPRIKIFDQGFQNYDLANCEGFERILVIDDGSHIYSEVLEAMEKFKKLISVGSYLIIEDGNVADVCTDPEMIQRIQGGPLRAISKFLPANDQFRVDHRWCDMFGINATFNTYGYLIKIKDYE